MRCPVLRERLAALMSLWARSEALPPEYPPVRARFAALMSEAALPAAGPATLAPVQRELVPRYRSLRAMLDPA